MKTKISELKVLQSNAGYYIGRTITDEYGEQPYSRESGYYRNKETAESALINDDYWRL